MKFILSVLLMTFLSFALGLYWPWWTVALACFMTSLFVRQKPFLSFLAGFLSVFILWASMAWFISEANDHILARRMSLLFLKSENPFLLMLVTALCGGLVGAFSALSGALLPMLLKK